MSFFEILYGDTAAVISVNKRPNDNPDDTNMKTKCAQNVVIGDGFSTAAAKNLTVDQQFKFDGLGSLALTTTSKKDDGTREIIYTYLGWWDDLTYFRMDVRLYVKTPGEVNPAPDVYPALSLLNTAIRLVQGEED